VQPRTNAVLFASHNIPFFARLGGVSVQELAIRIIVSLNLGLNIYCMTRMGYSILGIIAVGTGMSQVSAWRPPFGRLADTYTMRRFWGVNFSISTLPLGCEGSLRGANRPTVNSGTKCSFNLSPASPILWSTISSASQAIPQSHDIPSSSPRSWSQAYRT
jgi:hypothetical protein